MSSGPETETAVEVSTVEDDRLGHTLVLLLSRRDMPDTSRKPGVGKQTQFFARKKLQLLEMWEPAFPLPYSWGT